MISIRGGVDSLPHRVQLIPRGTRNGTSDDVLERRADEWNEDHVTTRAVGECDGTAADFPRRFVVFLHQDEFGPKFQLVDRFAETFVYPTEAASIYTVDCDIVPDVRPILTPDINSAERTVILSGVAASGSLEMSALARGIRDMLKSRFAVTRRFERGEGPDHWRMHRETLRRLRAGE